MTIPETAERDREATRPDLHTFARQGVRISNHRSQRPLDSKRRGVRISSHTAGPRPGTPASVRGGQADSPGRRPGNPLHLVATSRAVQATASPR
ncbi:hypothetical protein DFQ14_10370 [Halopolyspora algeriensis]|uniref:Uncharacterized protein n=1 Tax=Halopolyspora algeriensis TaxID=1500506 RepID=A0A368VXZ6_9ACTN|nr:hypothetical protein DFQ14_10370 [Halopolyspora algeriensis]TQM53171.1 hypothetical protein FHU43_2554 [Halopolyspora algeriensis]